MELQPWHSGLFLGLAAVMTLVSLLRSLPAQNVAVVTGFIVVISGIVQTVGAMSGIPFGPFVFTDAAGARLFDVLPWTMPLVWVAVVLNCRGVARLILRPWRKVRTYGFRVIGLTCLLVAFFDLGLEPFAARVNHFWVWQTAGRTLNWFGAPWVNFFSWALTALLILAFTTPWLINKKPGGKRPPDYHPLLIWLAMNLFITAILAGHQLWLAAGLVLVVSAVVTSLAWRNSRW